MNFSFEDEADMFADIFMKKYLSKIKRVTETKCDSDLVVIDKNKNQNEHIYNKIATLRIPVVYKEKISSFVDSTRVYSNKLYHTKLRKKQISKSHISFPTDFRIIQHIGRDSNNELEVRFCI